MRVETLAAWESRLRPFLARLPAPLAVRLCSFGRRRFAAVFAGRPPADAFAPQGLEGTLWGLRFRSPLCNAAGMFKNGRGYETVARQGAGAYLGGTTTRRPRRGNRRHGVALPFAPYPGSVAASNWLGLPNVGHREVARRLAGVQRTAGCPVGASAAACPDPTVDPEEKLAGLVAGLELYEQAGVDFLEINESCPNTGDVGGFAEMRQRLEVVGERFLARRRRNLPVVVKLSCDTQEEQVAPLVESLVDLGFDGVNFGNTSTDYARHRDAVAPPETPLYDYFTRTFGGGVSGRPLKADSLRLASAAVVAVRELAPDREFHVVRTGGVEDAADVRRSLAAGVSLCQWYSGYFEAFGRWGHRTYRRLYGGLAPG